MKSRTDNNTVSPTEQATAFFEKSLTIRGEKNRSAFVADYHAFLKKLPDEDKPAFEQHFQKLVSQEGGRQSLLLSELAKLGDHPTEAQLKQLAEKHGLLETS
jgi:hypothetical protein